MMITGPPPKFYGTRDNLHLRALQEFDLAELRRVNPIDTLREWSVKYGTANPDDWDLVRGVSK
jgi:hypothetical protein